MPILELRNAIRSYAWGSTRLLGEILGIANPDAGPQAELWMGAHPGAPSEIEIEGRWTSLAHRIAAQPVEILGADVAARFGGELPFLLKVLAAAEPLSLQVHPDPRRAEEGFRRENESGLALDAPDRNYRDPRAKPELLCALTDFDAMLGFRSPSDIRERLEPLSLPQIEAPLERLGRPGADAGDSLRDLFGTLLALDPSAARELAHAATARCVSRVDDGPEFEWVTRLATHHPDDALVIAPLLLHVIHLEPGDAIFLEAGELHSYLGGCGVEIMANSDNVLRGGLTVKHVDSRELLDVLTFSSGPPRIRRPAARGPCERVYDTPAAEFQLSRVELAPAHPAFHVGGLRGVEILLCVEGRIEARPDSGEPAVSLHRGSSVLIPADLTGYQLHGEGCVFRARVPD